MGARLPGPFRSGYVSIIGRPNVGKSTILNAVLGQKISIVSPRPQTTRNRIMGVKNLDNAQIIFIDTPGLHRPRTLLGESMVTTVREVLREIDVVVFVAETGPRIEQDRLIIGTLDGVDKPVILVINKIDQLRKAEILRVIDSYRALYPFHEIIPVSALKNDGVDLLPERIARCLPEGPKYYPDDLLTDQYERFMAAEIIREKIMERTSEEIPYSVAVEITDWTEREDGMVSIGAQIYVEREGQKGIIIGGKGRMLKTVGSLARMEIEGLLGTRVFLQLWVKVRKGWRDDKRMLHDLGYR
ncbi:MAG: GTPase Era [Nitrospiraceae bacterium]|nr:GTPase Era [Nitrospiraceae bacterium]